MTRDDQKPEDGEGTIPGWVVPTCLLVVLGLSWLALARDLKGGELGDSFNEANCACNDKS